MTLKGRVEKLENKFLPGNGVHVIDPKVGETTEQATRRYCAENRFTVKELGNRGPESLVILLKRDFGD